MKLLYISHLKGNVANGLSWSVPASVKAQSKFDEIYWINTSSVEMNHWKENLCFHPVANIKWNIFKNLPSDFKKPDIVIFEGFYDSLLDPLWGLQLSKNHIPYVIIPRSALSIKAMNNHSKFKKLIAHKLFYNNFINKASALHLLTRKEADETLCLYKSKYCIIPNGINAQQIDLTDNHNIGIKSIFIGRIDVYQKGIDLLLEAIRLKAENLRSINFSLDMYGPQKQDYELVCNIIKKNKIDDIVTLKGELFGTNKEKVLKSSDLFILTSRFEGHPMGLIEALSYSIPCMITEGTNMGTEVSKFHAGFTSDITIEGIAAMFDELLKQKDHLHEMRKQAILLSKEYDWESIAQSTHIFYSKILKDEKYYRKNNK